MTLDWTPDYYSNPQERRDALEQLLELISPGDVVYTSVKYTTRSALSRTIDLILIRENMPIRLAYYAARAVGLAYDDRRGGVRVSGWGLDMGFTLVYNLGRALWPSGFECLGPTCPSNEHHGNQVLSQNRHVDAGYALIQRWM